MKRLALALACLSLCAPQPAQADLADAGVSTSVLLTRTRLLSTEKARATLTIVNQASRAISFSPFSIAFLVRAGSQWEERPRFVTISLPSSPTKIAISSRFVMSLDLPSCPVRSDPCSEDVIVKYTIDIDGDKKPYQSAILRYEFIPDPTATYEVDGLNGNRPIFIAEGMSSDSFSPDTMLLTFTASPSAVHPPFTATPDLVAELAQAMRSAGVPIDQVGFDTDAKTWKARLFIHNASQQRSVVEAALKTVTTRFRQEIASVTQRYVLDLSLNDQGLTSRAESNARMQAQEIARLAGAGDFGRLNYMAGPPKYSVADPLAGRIIPSDSIALLYGQFVLIDAPPPSRLTVKAAIQELYVGANPVRLRAEQGIVRAATTAFRAPDWLLSPLRPQAAIAADRPEIYTFGAASTTAALAHGLAPGFAAILNARARTQSIAKLLGVRAENESLFALYPSDADSDVRAIGLATTFSGGDWSAWRGMKTDPSIRVGRMRDLRQTTMLPISIPDQGTVITELAGARTTVTRDFVRVEVEVDSAALAATTVNAGAVAAQLRRLPHVTGAAVRVKSDNDRFRARYEIAVKAAPKPEPQSIVELLRAIYRSFDPSISVAIQPLEANCPRVRERLLQATIRQNRMQAQNDAISAGRKLRKLLLVVAFPTDDQNLVCAPLAQDPGPFRVGYSGLESPLMSSSTMMVFRTGTGDSGKD